MDLDAKTTYWDAKTTSEKKSDCAVSYDQRTKTCDNGIEALLDQDHCFYSEELFSTGRPKHTCDVPENGMNGGPSEVQRPETTTLKNVDPKIGGKIVFHVSNYMVCHVHKNCPAGTPEKDTGNLLDSQAEVTVWHGDKWKADFKIKDIAKSNGFIKYGEQHWPKSWGTWHPEFAEWHVFAIDVKNSKVMPCTNKECD